MGYQAESGPWRSVYLQGAYELRNGVRAGGSNTAAPTPSAPCRRRCCSTISPCGSTAKAAGKKFTLNVEFTDLKRPIR